MTKLEQQLKKLTKLKLLPLTKEVAKDIIVVHHSFSRFHKSAELKSVELDFTTKEDQKLLKDLQTISETLKVEIGAIVTVMLTKFLENRKERTNETKRSSSSRSTITSSKSSRLSRASRS